MATSFFGKLYPSRTQSIQRPKINIRNQRENTGPSTNPVKVHREFRWKSVSEGTVICFESFRISKLSLDIVYGLNVEETEELSPP